MAKVEMSKIELLAPIEQSKEIFDFLQFSSVIDLSDSEDNGDIYKLSTSQTVSQFEKNLSISRSSLAVLDKYSPENKGLLSSFSGREEMPISEYLKKTEEMNKILNECYDINSFEKAISKSDADIARHRAMLDRLRPWLSLDIPMQFEKTVHTSAFIGNLPGEYSHDRLQKAFSEKLEGEDRFDFKLIASSQERSYVFVICHKECEEQVYKALRALGFAHPGDPTKHPPRVRYERLEKEIKSLELQKAKALKEIEDRASLRGDIEFLCDYFTIRKDKYDALSKLALSKRVFIINGYIATREADKLVKKLESKWTVAVSISTLSEDDEPPILLDNNTFSAPMESITEMYALPTKEDVDPSSAMSFFYYFFFGLMLSDAGYGIIMVLAAMLAKRFMKLESSMKKTLNMFLFCGISTIFWGVMFGGFFGDIIPVIAREFFNTEIPTASLALWFEPLADPMRLLMYSFLFGIVHLFAGLGVRFAMLWKSGKKLDAFLDVVPVYMLVTGAAPICAAIISKGIPEWTTSAGKYLAIIGLISVVLTAGRYSKNIFGKLGGGLFGLYNIGSGYLGDILSYSRLLALGLCTGVIASVVNLLGTIPQSTPVKAVVLVIAFIVGHTVNIAINLIGTYVHTNRLQYVEFFSKFYEGGGKAFSPLTANTKYFKLMEEK